MFYPKDLNLGQLHSYIKIIYRFKGSIIAWVILIFKSQLCFNHILFNGPTCILRKFFLKPFYPILPIYFISYFGSRSKILSNFFNWCWIWIEQIGSVSDVDLDPHSSCFWPVCISVLRILTSIQCRKVYLKGCLLW